MPTDMYRHLRSVAIDLLGPDTDPDSEYVRALVELTVNATATRLDNLDDLREDLERDLRLSCEPQQRVWIISSWLPESYSEFVWTAHKEDMSEKLAEVLRGSDPGTDVRVFTFNVPMSIFKDQPAVTITHWLEDCLDEIEGTTPMIHTVVAKGD